MGIINYFKEMVDHNLYDYLSDYQKREVNSKRNSILPGCIGTIV